MSSFNFSSVLCNAPKSAKSPEFIFMFDWFKRNADWRVQVDNCCQRAKVHRLVTLPEQSCKMSWSCCGIFFSGVCVNFEYLEMWIHYFSKCNSAHHYLISSKCKQLLFFAFIFRALLFFERFYFSSAFISRALLFLEHFYFCSLNVSQRLSFVLLGMKQCPIVVSK